MNRPEALNAFRPGTYAEVADAIRRAGWNREIGVIVLTGAGSRAFCSVTAVRTPASKRGSFPFPAHRALRARAARTVAAAVPLTR